MIIIVFINKKIGIIKKLHLNVKMIIYNHLMDVIIINIHVYLDVKNVLMVYVFFVKMDLNLIVIIINVNQYVVIYKFK